MSVAIGMGSDADEPIMRQAAEALNGSGVAWQMRVLSAHRSRTTPSTPPAGPPTAASRRSSPAQVAPLMCPACLPRSPTWR